MSSKTPYQSKKTSTQKPAEKVAESQRDEGGGEGTVRTAVNVTHTVGQGLLGIFGVPKDVTAPLGDLEQQAVTAAYDSSRKGT